MALGPLPAGPLPSFFFPRVGSGLDCRAMFLPLPMRTGECDGHLPAGPASEVVFAQTHPLLSPSLTPDPRAWRIFCSLVYPRDPPPFPLDFCDGTSVTSLATVHLSELYSCPPLPLLSYLSAVSSTSSPGISDKCPPLFLPVSAVERHSRIPCLPLFHVTVSSPMFFSAAPQALEQSLAHSLPDIMLFPIPPLGFFNPTNIPKGKHATVWFSSGFSEAFSSPQRSSKPGRPPLGVYFQDGPLPNVSLHR